MCFIRRKTLIVFLLSIFLFSCSGDEKVFDEDSSGTTSEGTSEETPVNSDETGGTDETSVEVSLTLNCANCQGVIQLVFFKENEMEFASCSILSGDDEVIFEDKINLTSDAVEYKHTFEVSDIKLFVFAYQDFQNFGHFDWSESGSEPFAFDDLTLDSANISAELNLARTNCSDDDVDEVADDVDNCVEFANSDQKDSDDDGTGDKCDLCADDPDKTDPEDCGCSEQELDDDNDSITDCIDNCPDDANRDQEDSDDDGVGDVCDEPVENNDSDNDGITDDEDNCPNKSNPSQTDSDDDEIGNVCDVCIFDPENDIDEDEFCADEDNCPDIANPDQQDSDSDGIGDVCDELVDDDKDDDGVPDSQDNCPDDPNQDQIDCDNDGIGDVCDTDMSSCVWTSGTYGVRVTLNVPQDQASSEFVSELYESSDWFAGEPVNGSGVKVVYNGVVSMNNCKTGVSETNCEFTIRFLNTRNGGESWASSAWTDNNSNGKYDVGECSLTGNYDLKVELKNSPTGNFSLVTYGFGLNNQNPTLAACNIWFLIP